MILSRLFSAVCVVGVAAAASIIACGDDGGKTPDAKVYLDAKVYMDAPPVSGLGQKCTMPSECPTNAPNCIAVQLSGGPSPYYCTPNCVTNGTMMTGSGGTPMTITPAPDNAPCTAAYTGGVLGAPTCSILLSWTPMDNPLLANKTYTNVNMVCLVRCGTGSSCPAGMTCISGGCFPM